MVVSIREGIQTLTLSVEFSARNPHSVTLQLPYSTTFKSAYYQCVPPPTLVI